MKRLEFYYDYACPYAYLGHTQIEGVAARTGAELVWKPFLLGGVFRAIGTPDVPAATMNAAKAKLNALDMMRWAEWFGVPLRMPATHPNRTVLALRATLLCPDVVAASKAFFRAYWVLARDLSQPEVVKETLDNIGLEGAAIVAHANDHAVKQELFRRTDEAIAAGVFGAPACVVTVAGRAPELYWGQDRLAMVERALGGEPPRREHSFELKTSSSLDFYFDFSSPFAYLAATQVGALAERTGARLNLRPLLLGGLFRDIGTPDVPLLAMPEAKRAHALVDMRRWAAHWGVPLNFPKQFPVRTVSALRLFLAAPEPQRHTLMLALFRAVWVDDRDVNEPTTLAAIASEAGLDGRALVARLDDPALKNELRTRTDEARKSGLCGVPTFGVGEQIYWGQDRLDFVEWALGAGRNKAIASAK